MKPLILKKEWEVKTIPNIHEWTHKDTLQVINDGIVKNIHILSIVIETVSSSDFSQHFERTRLVLGYLPITAGWRLA